MFDFADKTLTVTEVVWRQNFTPDSASELLFQKAERRKRKGRLWLIIICGHRASDIVQLPIMQHGPQNADRTAKRQREEKPVAECVVGGDPQTEI